MQLPPVTRSLRFRLSGLTSALVFSVAGLALAGCTGSDVASILAKKRVTLDGFDMNISAEETEEHPIVFKSMHIEYVFHGEGIDPKDVERAIELSQTKYCGVTAMFEKAMEITHSYRIETR